MTLTLDIPSEVEGVLLEAYPTARQLLAMPEAKRSRILSDAAAHAAPRYEADLALPPEQRELTAMSAIDDDFAVSAGRAK